MKLLIDTHCWLWWLAEPERLNAAASQAIASRQNEILLSAASSWEISIKYALGKLRLPQPPLQYVPSRLAAQGMSALPVHHIHALHVATLPSHHRDPFDRLLLAQAQVEELTLLTADSAMMDYDVKVLWASPERPPQRKRKSGKRR